MKDIKVEKEGGGVYIIKMKLNQRGGGRERKTKKTLLILYYGLIVIVIVMGMREYYSH